MIYTNFNKSYNSSAVYTLKMSTCDLQYKWGTEKHENLENCPVLTENVKLSANL